MMARPRINDKDKKVRINITLSKSVYNNLKNKHIKTSSFIDRLLRVALTGDTSSIDGFAEISRSRVQLPSEA
jgi:hypothetical protein